MRIGSVREWWSSISRTVKRVNATTWDETWQEASQRDRSVLVGTVIVGIVLIWASAVSRVVPAASWLGYYAICASLYGWLGRSRSIADAPGPYSGTVKLARQLGWKIPRYPNWTRDAFRQLPAGSRSDTGWVGRQLDGPAGVILIAVLFLAFAVMSQRSPDPIAAGTPVAVLVLELAPFALGLPIWQRVHMHRKAQRLAFVAQIDQEVSARFASSNVQDRAVSSPSPAPAGPSGGASSLRVAIWMAIIIGLAIELFFYLLPPLYR